MEIVRRPAEMGRRTGVLPGTFNPPTRAHVELARAALAHVDSVLFVLPRVLPHKGWEGAPPETRIEMLVRTAESDPRFGVALSRGGLYIEIAREARAALGGEIDLICGRDAAERIAGWDYGGDDIFGALLQEAGLLVAPRGGAAALDAACIKRLDLSGCDEISASEVRSRIRSGHDWRDLVPVEIADIVAATYIHE